MASSITQVSIALFLSLNILFFTMVSSTSAPCPPAPEKSHKHKPKTPSRPSTPSTPSTPSSPAKPAPKSKASCPIDTLKLGVCADLLGGLVHLVIGIPPKEPCCPLINGLANLEAAVCLCTALKANVLGVINLNLPIQLSLLLNYCGNGVPAGYQCA